MTSIKVDKEQEHHLCQEELLETLLCVYDDKDKLWPTNSCTNMYKTIEFKKC